MDFDIIWNDFDSYLEGFSLLFSMSQFSAQFLRITHIYIIMHKPEGRGLRDNYSHPLNVTYREQTKLQLVWENGNFLFSFVIECEQKIFNFLVD